MYKKFLIVIALLVFYIDGIIYYQYQQMSPLIRAQQIVEIMISKGTTDPKAYSLGTLLKENIGYLKSLSKE
jgi:CO dehydrogenase/acetyl-CoA synthase epsilon subunit